MNSIKRNSEVKERTPKMGKVEKPTELMEGCKYIRYIVVRVKKPLAQDARSSIQNDIASSVATNFI